MTNEARVVISASDQTAPATNSAKQNLNSLAKEAERAAQEMSNAASKTAYQNLQMANQLQDFAIQVAGGQNPLLAFAQQGSQLSAIYGGVGKAMRALMALVTPTTAAIGGSAIVVLGLANAWHKGEAQSVEFRRSLLLTGNAAGVTADSFEDMIDRVSKSAQKGKGDVRELAQALISSGRFDSSNIEKALQSAAMMSQITKMDADDVLKEYMRMSDAPAQYAAEVNKQMHFLSDAQLQYIQKLEASGHRQKALYEVLMALDSRYSKKVIDNKGTIEKALEAAGRAWNNFWDAAYGIGRDDTLDQKIAALQAKIKAAQNLDPRSINTPNFAQSIPGWQKQLEQYQAIRKQQQDEASAAAEKAAAEQDRQEKRLLEERMRGASLAFQAARAQLKIREETLDVDLEIYRISQQQGVSSDQSPASQLRARELLAKQELKKIDLERLSIAQAIGRAEASVIATKPETQIAAQTQITQLKQRELELNAQQKKIEEGVGYDRLLALKAEKEINFQWDQRLRGMGEVAREYEFQLSLIGKTTLEAQRLSDIRQIELRNQQEQIELGHRQDLSEADRDRKSGELARKRDEQLDAYARLHAERYQHIYSAEKGVSDAILEYTVRVQQAGERARDATQTVLRSMEDGLVNFVTKGKLDIKSFADVVIAEFARIKVAQPMVSAISAGASSFFSGLFGGGAAPSPSQSMPVWTANGNAFGFASGGTFTNRLFNAPTPFRFAHGAGMGLGVMGEAGPEAVMPLQRDARGRLGVIAAQTSRGSSAPSINVNVINQGGQAIDVTSKSMSRTDDGAISLDVVVRVVSEAIAGDVYAGVGPLARANDSRYVKKGVG